MRCRPTHAAAIALLVAMAPALVDAQELPSIDVAVLLPTEGPLRDLGQRALRDVALAAAYFDDVVWRTLDTSEGAAAAYEQAVALGAIAVLGPLADAELAALRGREEGLPVPVFSLSATHGVEDAGAALSRRRSRRAHPARALGGFVGRPAPGERPPVWAVAGPDVGWGAEATLGFVRGVSEAGGQVIAVATYDDERPDFAHVNATLGGERAVRLDAGGDPWRDGPASTMRHSRHEARRPDGVAILDYDDRVADLLPFLQFGGFLTDDAETSVALAGTSQWAGPSLPLVGDLAAGAWVVASYHPHDARPAAEAFTLEYGVRYTDDATEFDAQVYDAAAWVFALVDAVEVRDRASLVRAAAAGHEWSGAAGTLRLAPGGGAERGYTVWQVDGGGQLVAVWEIGPDGERW